MLSHRSQLAPSAFDDLGFISITSDKISRHKEGYIEWYICTDKPLILTDLDSNFKSSQ